MPKDMSNFMGSQSPTAGNFTVGETAFFYDSSMGGSRRFLPLPPHELPVQPDNTRSFKEKQEFLDNISSEMAYYSKSPLGRRRVEKALLDIESGPKGLAKECSRLRKRKRNLHELLHEAGRDGWKVLNSSQKQVDRIVEKFEDLLWNEEDRERLSTICDFIQSHRWPRKEMKYVREHPICVACKSQPATCTFTPKLVGGSVRCDYCSHHRRRCPRQVDYWAHLMAKATARPESVVKEILDNDRFRFKTAQIYDVDSTFGRGKRTYASSRLTEPKIDSDSEETADTMVTPGGEIKPDLDKLSAERDQLIKDGKQALNKISEAIQRGHQEKKKAERSIRAIVLVAHKSIDRFKEKYLLALAPPRL